MDASTPALLDRWYTAAEIAYGLMSEYGDIRVRQTALHLFYSDIPTG